MRPVTLAALAMVVVMAGPAAAQTYNPSTTFSNTSNPNGVWSYGYIVTSNGAFSTNNVTSGSTGEQPPNIIGWSMPNGGVIDYNQTQSVQQYGTVNWNPGEIRMHPTYDTGIETTLRFTAPAAGTYSVAASMYKVDSTGNGDTLTRILVNGDSVYSQIVSGYRQDMGSVNANYNDNLTLSTGDTIDLRVELGTTGYGYNSTGISYVITPVPEPATLLAVAAGGLLAARRWRQASGR